MRRLPLLLGGLLFVFGCGHLPFLSSPYVNFEFCFSGSAALLARGQPAQSLRYLAEWVPNPMGTVLAVAATFRLLGVSEFAARLPVLISATAVVAIMAVVQVWPSPLSGSSGHLRGMLAATLVAVNPMFWVYSGLVYSEVPFLFLAMCAVLVAFAAAKRNSLRLHLCAALLISAAALTKYNALAFAPVLIAVVVVEAVRAPHDERSPLWRILQVIGLYAVVGAALLLPYLFWTRAVLGRFLSLSYQGNEPSLSTVHMVPARLAAMLAWLGLFVGPFLFAPLLQLASIWRGKVAAAAWPALIAASCLGAYLIVLNQRDPKFSETELGWLRHFLYSDTHLWLVNAALLFAGIAALSGFVAWSVQALAVRYALLAWMLSFFAVHCLPRPSNRYILFVLPPLALYLAETIDQIRKRPGWVSAVALVVFGGCLLFTTVAVFNSAYYAAEGRAAATVARFVNQNRLAVPRVGELQGHCLYLIDGDRLVDDEHLARHQLVSVGRNERRADVVFEVPVAVGSLLIRRFAVVDTGSPQPSPK